MNITEFTNNLEVIPYAPQSQVAKGLLAPLLRASGHVLYLLAATAQTPEGGEHLLTIEEEIHELTAASEHLAGTNVSTAVLSEATRAHVAALQQGYADIATNFTAWNLADRLRGLRSLTNRTAGLAARLDRELAGISRDFSDPGISL